MRARTQATVTIAGAAIVALAALFAYEEVREWRFAELYRGMSARQVADHVGQPDFSSEEPVGIFFNCDTNKIARCWVYQSRFGSDYSVAFDRAGKVLCVAEYIVWT
jgi:hypothetical protein